MTKVYRVFKKKPNHLFTFEFHEWDTTDVSKTLKEYLKISEVGDLFIIEVAKEKEE